MDKPQTMFDRDFEWSELTRFATYPGPEATLGVVSGLCRQGKTFLLDALCRATGGFFFSATEATEAESLRQFGAAMARFEERPVPYRFTHWDEAVETMMRMPSAATGPMPIVLDLPCPKASPELPSLLQRALGPQARRENGPARLLLCGSALSFMELFCPERHRSAAGPASNSSCRPSTTGLPPTSGTSPIPPRTPGQLRRGRNARIRPGIRPRRRPGRLDDFGPWILRNVLNPGRPLFREARFLLAEEPDLRDTALYHGTLAAIAQGNHTRGGIAGFLERKSTDPSHALTVLEDTGLIIRSRTPSTANAPPTASPSPS